jgi:hypothetical protein
MTRGGWPLRRVFPGNRARVSRPDWQPDWRHSGALQFALGLLVIGAVVTYYAVSALVHAWRGNLGQGIIGVPCALCCLYLAVWLFWAYWHPKTNLRMPLPDRPYRVRCLYRGYGCGIAGVIGASGTGPLLVTSAPYSTSVGFTGLAFTLICFSVAGYFFHKYYKCPELMRGL